MSSGDSFSIGATGLAAAQRGLSTTGHNISNSTTEGYSRQRVNLETMPPTAFGSGGIGNGVLVSGIERVYDEFLTGQVRNIASIQESLGANVEHTRQIENMVADRESGLAPAMQDFFSAVNGLANNPSSTSSRQVLVSAARSLSDRFIYLDERMEILRTASNRGLETTIIEINEIASAIGEANKRIITASQIGGKPPNDLLDMRDKLLQDLSEHISIRTSYQKDGRLNVFVGNGQLLVFGDTTSRLEAKATASDPRKMDIIYHGPDTEAVVTKFITGGKIGGLLDFQKNILGRSQNEMGRIAIGISKAFNDQHKLGMDFHSQLGGNFFTETEKLAPQVLPNRNNKGDAIIKTTITDVDNLTTSDYELRFFDGTYSLIRLSDDELIGRYSSMPQEISEEGFTLSIEQGSSTDLDTYIIRPTRLGAQRIGVKLFDINKIAAASPIRVEASITNLGNAKISFDKVFDTSTPAFTAMRGEISPPYAVHFIDDNHFELLDNTGKPVAVTTLANPEDPAVLQQRDGRKIEEHSEHGDWEDEKDVSGVPAVENAIFYDPVEGVNIFPTPGGLDKGFRVHITGEPKKGDTFRIEYNDDGTTNNENALELAGLENRPTLSNGTANFTDVYSDLVTSIGAKAHELEINYDAQSLLLEHAKDRREAISGVNTDEEAVNLIRYQKLYQANAQAVAVANKMMDVLLSAFR